MSRATAAAPELWRTPPTVEPADADWSYPDMDADYDAGRNVWREVSEGFYEQALNVLPPMDWNTRDGSFLVMECQTHDANGAVYAGFARIGARHFARYVPRHLFSPSLQALRAVVRP